MVGREGTNKNSPRKQCAQGGTTAALVSKKAQAAELETPSSGVHMRSESFDEKWRGRYCWSSSRRCEQPDNNACKARITDPKLVRSRSEVCAQETRYLKHAIGDTIRVCQ